MVCHGMWVVGHRTAVVAKQHICNQPTTKGRAQHGGPTKDGASVGVRVGIADGVADGAKLGAGDGKIVGHEEGEAVGWSDGKSDGTRVGDA